MPTYTSFSNRRRRQMLTAVCLTKAPKVLLLTTIPSTKGIAKLVLKRKFISFQLPPACLRSGDAQHILKLIAYVSNLPLGPRRWIRNRPLDKLWMKTMYRGDSAGRPDPVPYPPPCASSPVLVDGSKSAKTENVQQFGIVWTFNHNGSDFGSNLRLCCPPAGKVSWSSKFSSHTTKILVTPTGVVRATFPVLLLNITHKSVNKYQAGLSQVQ